MFRLSKQKGGYAAPAPSTATTLTGGNRLHRTFHHLPRWKELHGGCGPLSYEMGEAAPTPEVIVACVSKAFMESIVLRH